MPVNVGQCDKWGKNRINASHMRFLRSLTSVTLWDQIQNEEIRNQWEVKEIAAEIQHYWHINGETTFLGCLNIVYQKEYYIIHEDTEI